MPNASRRSTHASWAPAYVWRRLGHHPAERGDCQAPAQVDGGGARHWYWQAARLRMRVRATNSARHGIHASFPAQARSTQCSSWMACSTATTRTGWAFARRYATMRDEAGVAAQQLKRCVRGRVRPPARLQLRSQLTTRPRVGLVLGAGGTARAACYALNQLGVRDDPASPRAGQGRAAHLCSLRLRARPRQIHELIIHNRTLEKAQRLALDFNGLLYSRTRRRPGESVADRAALLPRACACFRRTQGRSASGWRRWRTWT